MGYAVFGPYEMIMGPVRQTRSEALADRKQLSFFQGRKRPWRDYYVKAVAGPSTSGKLLTKNFPRELLYMYRTGAVFPHALFFFQDGHGPVVWVKHFADLDSLKRWCAENKIAKVEK